ncbi:MAG: Hsp20/alpha crystallin family protein [Acidobacteria bacterium]|nr:Hsp20/alpha crystallin family protein [Acidobacteriota bacterium]
MIGKGRSAQLEVARIQSEINRLFETLLRLRDGGVGGTWSPGVDVAESATHLVVEADLPGVDPDSLQVEAQGGTLILRGERRPGEARLSDGAEVLHDEREFGRFERSVLLTAPVNTHSARAVLDRGVLKIELPKVPNRRGQAVTIDIERANP